MRRAPPRRVRASGSHAPRRSDHRGRRARRRKRHRRRANQVADERGLALVRPAREDEQRDRAEHRAEADQRDEDAERLRALVQLEAHEARDHERDRRRREHPSEDHEEHERGEAALAEDVADAVGHCSANTGARGSDLRAGAGEKRKGAEDGQEAEGVQAEYPGRPGGGKEDARDRRPDETRDLERDTVQRDRALQVFLRHRGREHRLESREAE